LPKPSACHLVGKRVLPVAGGILSALVEKRRFVEGVKRRGGGEGPLQSGLLGGDADLNPVAGSDLFLGQRSGEVLGERDFALHDAETSNATGEEAAGIARHESAEERHFRGRGLSRTTLVNEKDYDSAPHDKSSTRGGRSQQTANGERKEATQKPQQNRQARENDEPSDPTARPHGRKKHRQTNRGIVGPPKRVCNAPHASELYSPPPSHLATLWQSRTVHACCGDACVLIRIPQADFTSNGQIGRRSQRSYSL